MYGHIGKPVAKLHRPGRGEQGTERPATHGAGAQAQQHAREADAGAQHLSSMEQSEWKVPTNRPSSASGGRLSASRCFSSAAALRVNVTTAMRSGFTFWSCGRWGGGVEDGGERREGAGVVARARVP